MALAILELVDVDSAAARFRVDTGTNTKYQLRVGGGLRENSGIEWVNDVYFTTPLQTNSSGGDLLDSSLEVSLPAGRFRPGGAYVQLFTFKDSGRSPAFSEVVEVPALLALPGDPAMSHASSASFAAGHGRPRPGDGVRAIGHRGLARASSAPFEDLLGAVVRAATPVVLDLLRGNAVAGTNGTAPAPAGQQPHANGTAELLASLLRSILGSAAGGAPGAAAASAPASLAAGMSGGNGFAAGRANGHYARPFLFGVDDALLASLAGPVIQVLPQLVNAANQRRLQLKQADNQLVAGILADIGRRMTLESLLDAQRRAQENGAQASAPADGGPTPEQLAQLAALLRQAATAPPPAAPAPAATQQSLAQAANGRALALSARAALSLAAAEPLAWNGTRQILFAKGRPLALKLRFDVAEPAPKAPLPKAILKLVLQDKANPLSRHEKVVKLKGVAANGVIDCAFSPAELAHMPAGRPITVLAQLRWPSAKAAGGECAALGSAELVLVGSHFVREQGSAVSAERELTDMRLHRAFWNKIWEAPVLDASPRAGGGRKLRWALDVEARYTVLLSADHGTNGVMDTRTLALPAEEGVTHRTAGRLKAGIELSLDQLNRLRPLWDGAQPLDGDRLAALAAKPFLDANAGEFRYRFKLDGRAGQRGMVWVVPTFRLFDVALSAVSRVDEATGQVLEATEEHVQLPLPVGARLLGLRSAA